MAMSLRALVVDDEQPARDELCYQLGRLGGVEVLGQAENGLDALAAIERLRPDVVFLDVQMPGLDGFEVIETVGLKAMPPVVFVTAYDQYAIKAFEVQALDYLLKPYDEERFKRAYSRALKSLRARDTDPEKLSRLLEAVRPGARFLQRLVVRQSGRLYILPVAEVVRFTARENYVEAVTTTARHLLRATLSSLESRLDPDRFARIHRSEIVALDWILELQPWTHGDYVILLKNGDKVRLSRRYQQNVLGRDPNPGAGHPGPR